MDRIKWDSATVLDAIHFAYNKGGIGNITYSDVDNIVPGTVNAAARYFGNYRKAVETAITKHGLDITYKEVLDEPYRRRREKHNEEVLEWLHKRWLDGDSLDHSECTEGNGSCITIASPSRYGSWRNVIEELKRRYPDVTIDYEDILALSRGRRHEIVGDRARKKVLEEIFEMHKKGVSIGDPHYLSPSNAVVLNRRLYDRATNNFNHDQTLGWKNAVLEMAKTYNLDLDYDQISLKASWSRQKINDMIRIIGFNDKMMLYASVIDQIESELFHAATNEYGGSWIKAVESNGFNYGEIKEAHLKRRKQEKIESTRNSIISYIIQGKDLNRARMKQTDIKLVRWVNKEYGSWYDAVEDAITSNLYYMVGLGKDYEIVRELNRVYEKTGSDEAKILADLIAKPVTDIEKAFYVSKRLLEKPIGVEDIIKRMNIDLSQVCEISKPLANTDGTTRLDMVRNALESRMGEDQKLSFSNELCGHVFADVQELRRFVESIDHQLSTGIIASDSTYIGAKMQLGINDGNQSRVNEAMISLQDELFSESGLGVMGGILRTRLIENCDRCNTEEHKYSFLDEPYIVEDGDELFIAPSSLSKFITDSFEDDVTREIFLGKNGSCGPDSLYYHFTHNIPRPEEM
jgi:hypothetical protein